MHPALTSGLTGLLAVQFATQPVLVRSFVHKHVTVSSLVFAGEVLKLVLCPLILLIAGRLRPATERWSLTAAFREAALPSTAYALQNILTTTAIRHLNGVTFNVLNQTKLLFTAFFVFILRERQQTQRQCVALSLIFVASVLTAAGECGSSRAEASGGCGAGDGLRGDLVGIIAAVTGAMLSGLGAVLSEVVLVQKQRDALLFSAELAVGGMLAVGLNLLLDLNGDGSRWSSEGFFVPWTAVTWLPVLSNATNGILVGVVTKALGSVRKAFAATAGLLISAVLTVACEGQLPPRSLCWGVALTAVGVRLYCAGPGPRARSSAIGDPEACSDPAKPWPERFSWVEAYPGWWGAGRAKGS